MPRCASAHLAAAMAMSEVATFSVGDVALANAGALDDPLIVGFDHFFEIVVGEYAGRYVAAQRGDFRLGH